MALMKKVVVVGLHALVSDCFGVAGVGRVISFGLEVVSGCVFEMCGATLTFKLSLTLYR